MRIRLTQSTATVGTRNWFSATRKLKASDSFFVMTSSETLASASSVCPRVGSSNRNQMVKLAMIPSTPKPQYAMRQPIAGAWSESRLNETSAKMRPE